MHSDDSPRSETKDSESQAETGYDVMQPVDGYQFVTGFVPGPGGVLTDEAGALEGEQTLRTEVTPDGQAALYVRPVESEQWYTVTGGHYHLDDPARAEDLHRAAVELLSTGGADASSLTLS